MRETRSLNIYEFTFEIMYICSMRAVSQWLGLHSFFLFTSVRGPRFQKFNGMQMLGCGDGERQNIADSLVETGVGSAAEAHRLVLVLQVILDVAHLVVNGKELLHRYCSALLDPKE